MDVVKMPKWTRAYINNLPDSAFLIILPGGKKDTKGKTVPRDKRKFPVRNPDGTINIAHLRNALARIPQSDISEELKAKAKRKAEKLLADWQRKHGKTEKSFIDGSGRVLIKATSDSAQVDEDKEALKHLDMAIKLLRGNKKVISHLERVRAILEADIDHELEEIKQWKTKKAPE